MTKTKLPTLSKGGKKCKNCSAILIHSYDYANGIYKWSCSGCGATRYDSGIRFETRFQQADKI